MPQLWVVAGPNGAGIQSQRLDASAYSRENTALAHREPIVGHPSAFLTKTILPWARSGNIIPQNAAADLRLPGDETAGEQARVRTGSVWRTCYHEAFEGA
jgi:hypothetical protein